MYGLFVFFLYLQAQEGVRVGIADKLKERAADPLPSAGFLDVDILDPDTLAAILRGIAFGDERIAPWLPIHFKNIALQVGIFLEAVFHIALVYLLRAVGGHRRRMVEGTHHVDDGALVRPLHFPDIHRSPASFT